MTVPAFMSDPEPGPPPHVNGGSSQPVSQAQDPAALTVVLPLAAWQRVLQQLGEGSVNQFLGVLTAMQQQLQHQLSSQQRSNPEA